MLAVINPRRAEDLNSFDLSALGLAGCGDWNWENVMQQDEDELHEEIVESLVKKVVKEGGDEYDTRRILRLSTKEF